LPVQGESKVPVDVFGSGPQVIDVGDRLGNKLTVAVGAEPERIAWAVGTAREVRRAAGLDPEAMDIGAFIVVGAGTDQRALDELVRGNASISAHFQRGVTSALSPSDATVVEEVTSRYDNYHHGLEHAAQAEVIPADFLHRFCVIGSPDACTERLCRLVELGLSHLVVGSREIDASVRESSDHLVAKEILPAVQAVELPVGPG
jgi:5,10-methylenetetrahydromethanopterin reductase